MQLNKVTIEVGPKVQSALLRFQCGKLPAGFEQFVVDRPARNANLLEGTVMTAKQEPWQHLVPGNLIDDFLAAKFGLAGVRVYRDESGSEFPRATLRHVIILHFSKGAESVPLLPDVRLAYQGLSGDGWRLLVYDNPLVKDGKVVKGGSHISVNLRERRQIGKDEPAIPLRLVLAKKTTAIVEA